MAITDFAMERNSTMKMWIDENNQRCCDRSTAIELGGQKFSNMKITLIYHFDEFIQIVDEDDDSPGNEKNNE